MSLADAYESDLRGLVEELEKQDVFAQGEAEAWYEGIDEAEDVSDLAIVNDAIQEILGDSDGLNRALDEQNHHETNAFF